MLDERTESSEPVNPDVHHETTDVDVRAILWFTVIFVAFAIFAHVALYVHYAFLRKSQRDPELLPISLVDRGVPKLPPEPRLQPFPSPDGEGVVGPLESVPPQDMEEMRREQARRLSSWEWVNRETGTVRIPIDRAMELQLQRGFPVAAEPAAVPPPSPNLPDQVRPATPAASPATEPPSR